MWTTLHVRPNSLYVPQGHKRAPSDVSVASTEDEKICLSPTLLDSVPEKMETIPPVAKPTELSAADTVEESPVPAHAKLLKETSNAPLDDGEVHQKAVEEKPPPAEIDPASPGTEVEPVPPVTQMHHLEITAKDNKDVEVQEKDVDMEEKEVDVEEKEVDREEKEVDTGEILPNEQASRPMSEVSEDRMEESESPTEEEDQYNHLKVTLTLPENNKVVQKEETEEKPTGKDNINMNEEKIPDKTKDARKRDSYPGSVSATDNRNVDLNLSISSFLSKAKEPASVSIQVIPVYESFRLFMLRLTSSYFFIQAPEEDLEKDSQIHRGWSGS